MYQYVNSGYCSNAPIYCLTCRAVQPKSWICKPYSCFNFVLCTICGRHRESCQRPQSKGFISLCKWRTPQNSQLVQANKMALNVCKTKFFAPLISQLIPLIVLLPTTAPDDPALISPIERIHNDGRETSFKLLDVLLDEFLSFNDHVSMLTRKISKSLYCINRVKNFIDQKSIPRNQFC